MTSLEEEIKKSVSDFIERRLIASRDIQDLKHQEDKIINADSFIELHKKYDDIISDLLVKIHSSDKGSDEYRQATEDFKMMTSVKQNLGVRSSNVRLSDQNISDIMTLINRYFDIISFDSLRSNSISLNSTYFLKEAFDYLSHEDEESKELASKYATFFATSYTAGFDPSLDGHINFGDFEFVKLSDNDNNVVFLVDKDKNVVTPYNREKDSFVFGKDVVFGFTVMNGVDSLIPVRKIETEDGPKYINFLLDDQILEETPEASEGKIQPLGSLKELFNSLNLNEYYEEIYTKRDMVQLLKFVGGFLNMSEEERQKYDETSRIATDWWMGIVNDSVFTSSFGSINGVDIDALNSETLGNANLSSIDSGKLEALNNSVKCLIKRMLVTTGVANLYVSDYPDYHLLACVDKLGLDESNVFQHDVSMSVKLDEIVARQNDDIVQVFKSDDQPHETDGNKRNL